MVTVRNLILVLGDQLTPTLSSLAAGDPAQDRVLMAELSDEASYVRHHKKRSRSCFRRCDISPQNCARQAGRLIM